MLKQHLARFCKKAVNLAIYLWINHQRRPLAVRAGQAGRSAKEATNQGALTVYLASIITKIGAVEFGQRRFMLLIAFDRKPGHLFCRGCNRSTAIVASQFAFKCRNTFTQKPDFLTIFCHLAALF